MDFIINDPRIDADHSTILQLLDSSRDLPDGADPRDLRRLLVKVKHHVVVHFVDEEFIFEKQYSMPPDYVTMHKQEHVRIRDVVLDSVRDAEDPDGPVIRERLTSIRREIERHIFEVDAQMNDYLPARR